MSGPVFTVEMLAGGNGDALWIEYGDPDRPFRILVDGGTEPTRTTLAARFGALPDDQRHVELLIVTHIDGDHIGGILDFLEKQMVPVTFGDVWFNGYRHLPDTPVESLGPVQGERLTDLLVDPARGLPWNQAFDGKAVVVPDADQDAPAGDLPAHELEGGMKLTLLSPGWKELSLLKPEWAPAVKDANLDPKAPVLPGQATGGLEVLGPPPEPPDPADIPALAARDSPEDPSKPNGSSVGVLAEYGGHRILLTGDGHSDVLVRSIRRLAAKEGMQRLKVDAFKLPHHGSNGNVLTELVEAVECGTYLFSTNGVRHFHPHQEAVSRVLVSGGPSPVLVFNYVTNFTRFWGEQPFLDAWKHHPVYPDADGRSVTRLSQE